MFSKPLVFMGHPVHALKRIVLSLHFVLWKFSNIVANSYVVLLNNRIGGHSDINHRFETRSTTNVVVNAYKILNE